MTKIKTSTGNLDEVILADSRVERLFKAKQSGTYAVNTKQLMDELEDLMVARKYVNIEPNEFLQSAKKRTTAWQLELSSTRSRATLIKMTTFKILSQLKEQLKATKGYILNTYSSEISQKHTSITARKDYVEHLLEPLQKIASKLESVIILADILIADLDQGSRLGYNVVETLKIYSQDK